MSIIAFGRPGLGSGRDVTIIGAAPAVGEDPTVTVPAGVRWRLYSMLALLFSAATVASRRPDLLFSDGAANQILASICPFVITAGQFARVVSFAGLDPVGLQLSTGSMNYGGFPDNYYIDPGTEIRYSTSLLQAGDQWTGLIVRVEEFDL